MPNEYFDGKTKTINREFIFFLAILVWTKTFVKAENFAWLWLKMMIFQKKVIFDVKRLATNGKH